MAATRLDQLRNAVGASQGGDFFTQFVVLRRESDRLRNRAWRLAAGPILVAAGGGAAMAVGMAIVVPELKQICDSAGLRANPASELAISAAELGKTFWLLVSISLLTAGHVPWLLRHPTERWLEKSFLFGSVWRAIDEAEWSRTTALFLSVGKSVPQAMRLADQFVGAGGVPLLGRVGAALPEPDRDDPGSAAVHSRLSAKWEPLLGRDENLPAQLAHLQQLASRSAARAGTHIALWSAAIWPAALLALLLLALVLGNAACEPVLAYLRSWA